MKKVKIGVFGGFRGKMMMKYCLYKADEVELVAICDKNEEVLKSCDEAFKEKGLQVKLYENFDDMIKNEKLDGVVLANYADEHAPFAIKALNSGINVFSEVLPARTMKEAVELVEAVEKSGKIYSYSENYCFFPCTIEMKRLYDNGELGEFEYGEGEYFHNLESYWPEITYGIRNHWRNEMSGFYYCTHSAGPLIHITGLRPTKVMGYEVKRNDRIMRMGAQGAPIVIEMVTMSNGGLFKSGHGVGVSKNSTWFSIYGSLGRVESGREINNDEEFLKTVHVNVDKSPEKRVNKTITYKPMPDGYKEANEMGHVGGDYYTMKNFIKAIRGEKAEIIDVYEALDMFFVGQFAFFSAIEGKALDIPNFRIKEEREPYRNDTRCCGKKYEDDKVLDASLCGNYNYPESLYQSIKEKFVLAQKNNKEMEEKEKTKKLSLPKE